MRRILTLTKTLLRDWVRNREAVFFALLFPLILLVIFSTVFAGGPTEFDLGVQNNDLNATGEPTELSAELLTALEETSALDVDRLDSEPNLSEADSVEATTGHKRVLIIPEGFDQRVRTESARVRKEVIRDTIEVVIGDALPGQQEPTESEPEDTQTDQQNGDAAELILITAPDDQAGGAVGSILDSVMSTFNDRSIGVETPTATVVTEQRGQTDLGASDYFLPAFIVAMIMINGVMTVPSAVATVKKDGTLKRLAVTPLRKHEWIAANVIQQSILAVAISMIMVVVARVLFGVSALPGPIAIGLIVLGAVAFTALGMVVAGVIQNPDSAVSLGGAIALPVMFISGIFWEIDLMPPTLQTVAEFSPVTHFHRSLRQVMILDSTDGVAVTAGLLAILAVVFLAVAVSLTNWQEFD